jgi:hypothetical protein
MFLPFLPFLRSRPSGLNYHSPTYNFHIQVGPPGAPERSSPRHRARQRRRLSRAGKGGRDCQPRPEQCRRGSRLPRREETPQRLGPRTRLSSMHLALSPRLQAAGLLTLNNSCHDPTETLSDHHRRFGNSKTVCLDFLFSDPILLAED